MDNQNSRVQSVVSALTKNYLHITQENVDSFVDEKLVNKLPLEIDVDTNEKGFIKKRQGFRVGDLNLMISYEDGKEITELPTVYPLPNSPEWFLGFSNLNGELIPVFDLTIFLSTGSELVEAEDSFLEQKKQPMLLVLGHEDNATGVVIEELPSRMQFHSQDMLANELIPNKLKGIVKGVISQSGKFWFDLELVTFIKELEDAIKRL